MHLSHLHVGDVLGLAYTDVPAKFFLVHVLYLLEHLLSGWLCRLLRIDEAVLLTHGVSNLHWPVAHAVDHWTEDRTSSRFIDAYFDLFVREFVFFRHF